MASSADTFAGRVHVEWDNSAPVTPLGQLPFFIEYVVARAVSDPAAVVTALGEPQRTGLHKLYQSPDLTVLNVIWAPMMTVMPHNHRMWALIGIYSGREDNIFWPASQGAVRRFDDANKLFAT